MNAHLSLHFLLFQFDQRQTREVHHACKHTRASRVSLEGGDHDPSHTEQPPKLPSPRSEICCCPCLVDVTTTAAMSLT